MSFTDEQLYNMSDDELESAFAEAKADESSPDLEQTPEDVLPEPSVDEVEVDEEEFDTDEVTDEIDDEEVEDLEQPEKDSEDDTSSDEDDEDEDEEDSDEDEVDPDGDDEESEDEDPDEDEDESDDDEQPIQKFKYKANGKDYEFSQEEILEKFGQVFGQAQNYTQKMQSIKPWRKTIDAIEQADLSAEDINLAIDVLKGDKDAIASLLKRTGTDALELDVDNVDYQPKDYGRNETEIAIKDIVDEIKDDPEYNTTYNVLEKQWDSTSRNAFAEDPEMIRQLHIDVKSGMYDIIAPMATKRKVYDNGRGSDLDYYKEAAKEYFDQQNQEAEKAKIVEEKTSQKEEIARVKTATKKRSSTKASSAKRKAAAPTKKAAGAAKVTDYLDGADDSYEDWYKDLEASF
jgi:hypothetical protein